MLSRATHKEELLVKSASRSLSHRKGKTKAKSGKREKEERKKIIYKARSLRKKEVCPSDY